MNVFLLDRRKKAEVIEVKDLNEIDEEEVQRILQVIHVEK